MNKVTAISPANIAFIKYWGNRDENQRIPFHGSISMNVTGAQTETTVEFSPDLTEDELVIDGQPAPAKELQRVSVVLDQVRQKSGLNDRAKVTSTNSFPKGAGIASSASAFSALAIAASAAAGLELSKEQLSALARLGSGSASRSIPDGFVEWLPGEDHKSSYAVSLYPPNYWDIVDVIAIVSGAEKKVGSTAGHALAQTSRLYPARLATMPERIVKIKEAMAQKNFTAFGQILEEESYNLHAIMMTSHPGILYWTPATVEVLHTVETWRENGLEAYCTMDAGPNVHIICQGKDLETIQEKALMIPGVQKIIVGKPTNGAQVVTSESMSQ